MMKDRRIAVLFYVLSMGMLLGACSSSNSKTQMAISEEATLDTDRQKEVVDESEEKTDLINIQEQLYAIYTPHLDQMLANNEQRIENCEPYQEFVSSIYLFSGDYHGWLQADYDEKGIAAIKMRIKYGDFGSDSWDNQIFIGKILEDGSLWLSYETTYEETYDLPDYVVNEDVLRYSRADYVYDNGSMDVNEQKQENSEQIAFYLNERLFGKQKEYWCNGDKIYQIDRKSRIFTDVTEEMGGLVVSFFAQQPQRIACQLNVQESVVLEVEKKKPAGYSFLSDWNDIAVSDLNKDGLDDYVMALYPDDFEEVRRYAEFSPYEMSSEYYAASFWLLLSTENGDYEQIQLSNTVEYRDNDALRLVEVSFVKEDILQLEYFIGRSPWVNSVLQFQYDEEWKNFYVYRSYYRDMINGFFDGLFMGDEKDYGKRSIWNYFVSNQYYDEERWRSTDNIVLSDNAMLTNYSSCFHFGCENQVEEHRINSLIWEKEYELIKKLEERYSDRRLEIRMYTDPVLYSDNVISGFVDIRGDVEDDRDLYDFSFIYPIMIDRTNGEYLSIVEKIDQKTFLQIFRNWASAERNLEVIKEEEIKSCEKAIKKHWNTVESPENFMENPKETLYLQVVSEGVKINVWNEEKERIHFIIDRECFLGTDLWEYVKPEWH